MAGVDIYTSNLHALAQLDAAHLQDLQRVDSPYRESLRRLLKSVSDDAPKRDEKTGELVKSSTWPRYEPAVDVAGKVHVWKGGEALIVLARDKIDDREVIFRFALPKPSDTQKIEQLPRPAGGIAERIIKSSKRMLEIAMRAPDAARDITREQYETDITARFLRGCKNQMRLHKLAVAAGLQIHIPGVFRIHEPGEGKHELYCTMEYCPGAQLIEWCRDEKTDLDLLELLAKLVNFVKFLHEKGFIHRDIKTGNVLVSPTGNPVLLDYGLCKDLRAPAQEITMPGTSLGTPAYSEPASLIDAASVAYEADFLPLGRVMWCMFTRGLPDLFGVRAFYDADGKLHYDQIEIQARFPASAIKDLATRLIFEKTQTRGYLDISEIYNDVCSALSLARERATGQAKCDFGKCTAKALDKRQRILEKKILETLDVLKEWKR